MPVLDLGIQPDIIPQAVRLELGAEHKYSHALSWDDINKLAQTTITTDIHCVTSWSMYDTKWGGVATATILELVNPQTKPKFVWLESYDGYSTNIPLADFLMAKSLVATSLNGEPIPKRHGGPLRLVVPHLYFWKSPKWLKKISFNERDKRGFWEERGYHNYGDPWKQQRYSTQE